MMVSVWAIPINSKVPSSFLPQFVHSIITLPLVVRPLCGEEFQVHQRRFTDPIHFRVLVDEHAFCYFYDLFLGGESCYSSLSWFPMSSDFRFTFRCLPA